MADDRHIAHHKIAIFNENIIRFRWNFVHHSTFGTLWETEDQM